MPPHHEEAEHAVVAACFDSYQGFDELEVAIEPSDFYSVWIKTVWESMLSLRERKIPIDHVAVKNDLMRRGVEVDQDRVNSLITLECDTVPTSANLNYYAKIVVAMSRKRKLIEVGARIVELGFSPAKVREVYNSAHELLSNASADRATQEIVNADQLAREVFEHLRNPTEDAGLVSGWYKLDRVIQCFRPGEMTVLAGRPSMGKSSLMLALTAAMLGKGERVGICSLEMQRLQLACNAIGARAGVDTTKIRRGAFGETGPGEYDEQVARDEKARTLDGIEWLSDFGDRLAVFDGDVTSITQIGRVIERMVTRNRIKIVALDYMQLLDGDESTRNLGRYEEITQVSKGLKRIARRLKIHVLCLAQLSRKVEERRDKKPIMSDLRDSGQVEQDADVIMLLHRPEYYWPDKPDLEGLAILDVCKNRNGPTGVVRLEFTKEFTRFDPE